MGTVDSDDSTIDPGTVRDGARRSDADDAVLDDALHDVLDDVLDDAATTTPLVPIVMLVLSSGAAIAYALLAYLDDAGTTDEISGAAVAAWAFGSLVGLLIFAWWGLLDAERRSTGTYQEPSFRPQLVAGVLVAVGWLAGLSGALMVGLSVARS